MSEWRPTTWGEEIVLEYGKALRGYDRERGQYRVFGSNGPIGWTTEPITPGPGVVLGRKGAYRGVEYCAEPFFVIDTAYYVVPRTELDVRWLYYAMKYHRLGEIDDGSPIPSTTRSAVYVRDLEVPPPTEQRAIAQILGVLDDKIELNRRTSEMLEAVARALYKDWFIDFGPVRAKMEGREPHLAPDVWASFPGGLDGDGNPHGWTRGPVRGWLMFNPVEPLRKGTVAPYVDMAALPTHGCTPDAPVQREFGSGMRFRNGDTLLARITPCLENGKTAFIQSLPESTVAWGSTEFIVMRPKPPVPAPYAYLLARDPSFRQHAIRSMTGTSGRQRAQADSVAGYTVCLPTEEPLWKAFTDQTTPIFNGIRANADEAQTLSQLRDSLLPKLISGELRVKDAERFIEGAMP